MIQAAHCLKPDWQAPSNVEALCTTRLPLFASDKALPLSGFDHFNLALHVEDNAQVVINNRAALAKSINIPTENLFWLTQTHGTDVLQARLSTNAPNGDASFSQTKKHVCAIMTADCLPVLFCNREGTMVAAAHAGWRSLASGILEKTVAKFDQPEQVMAWFGPAISQNHFEVGAEVKGIFCDAYKGAETHLKQSKDDQNKYFADLYGLAKLALNGIGVENISGGGYCTYHDQERFYSYRRDGKQSGRMASLIWLK